MAIDLHKTVFTTENPSEKAMHNHGCMTHEKGRGLF